jgi:DNA polymerase-3 subunit chi
MLLAKCRAAGWRVAVRGRDAGLLQRLDATLWNDGFLPHGLTGGAHDADQPVLLGTDVSAQGFQCVMSIGGADVTASEVGAAERVCVLFDGHDEGALNHARGQWKSLTGDGCKAQYWAQEDGRWTKKAES